ncbi:MAG: class I tRNA ligase family protein, partial [Chthoniobacterales bacterium]
MSEISKAYEPGAVEEKWYAEWLKQGCFSADPASSKPSFSIVIPPPNVTGVLTLGHVLNNTLQDILARRALFPPLRPDHARRKGRPDGERKET